MEEAVDRWQAGWFVGKLDCGRPVLLTITYLYKYICTYIAGLLLLCVVVWHATDRLVLYVLAVGSSCHWICQLAFIFVMFSLFSCFCFCVCSFVALCFLIVLNFFFACFFCFFVLVSDLFCIHFTFIFIALLFFTFLLYISVVVINVIW